MSVPGPGWYSDASQGNRVRWWDGSTWSDGPAMPTPAPKKPSTLPKVLIASAIGVVVLIIVAVSGGFFQLIVIVGLLAAAIGAYAAAVGSAPRFRVRSRKIGAIVLGVGLFAAMVGGTANAAVSSSSTMASLTAPRVESPSSPAPEEPPSPKPTPTPAVTQKEVREPVVIPFGSTTVNDANLAVGTTTVTVPGVNGEKVIVHQVTYVDGVETEREVLREEITVQPVTQVTSVGTKEPVVVAPAPPAPPAAGNGCDANYAGACVPIASDVDCEGGGGDGPGYVRGPVRIVGSDPYRLDRDGDGIACD